MTYKINKLAKEIRTKIQDEAMKRYPDEHMGSNELYRDIFEYGAEYHHSITAAKDKGVGMKWVSKNILPNKQGFYFVKFWDNIRQTLFFREEQKWWENTNTYGIKSFKATNEEFEWLDESPSPSGQAGIDWDAILPKYREVLENHSVDGTTGIWLFTWIKEMINAQFNSAQIPVREEKLRKIYEYAVNEGRLWIHSPVDKEGYADEMNESWERFKLSPDFGGIK